MVGKAEKWRSYLAWLVLGETRVVIPFAETLVELMPAPAVRQRRDTTKLFTLVSAHALLNREHRPRDAQGRIVATIEDYAAVRALTADLFSEGVATSVSAAMRETVHAVEKLATAQGAGLHVPLADVARELNLDRSSAFRRVTDAIACGFLDNSETRKGRPMALHLGAKMPDDNDVLPLPETLEIFAGVNNG